MADLTIEDLDRLDGLWTRSRDSMAGETLRDAYMLEAALAEAWPSVSAMLRRALAPPPGLVFGEPTATGVRYAPTTVPAMYALRRVAGGRWRWNCPEGEWDTHDTESEAIAAATAHNDARLAKKGGE